MYILIFQKLYILILTLTFFDTVNQDKLITIIGRTITDGDVVSLIRKYLSAGVMEKGIIKATRHKEET